MSKKDAYYFSHDCNARNDVKILRLRREMGLEGYGIYWCLIEVLRESPEYQLPTKAIEDIAFSLNLKTETVARVVNEFELFKTESDYFYSERLIRNMELLNGFKAKRSEAGKVGMEKRWNNKKPNSSFV